MLRQEVSSMSLQQEFVLPARQEGADVREPSRHFGVSPKTGYKWQRRFEAESEAGFIDPKRMFLTPLPASGGEGVKVDSFRINKVPQVAPNSPVVVIENSAPA